MAFVYVIYLFIYLFQILFLKQSKIFSQRQMRNSRHEDKTATKTLPSMPPGNLRFLHSGTPPPKNQYIFMRMTFDLCRGGLHPAAVLGAAAVGGPAPEGLPPLPVSERVAAQGEPESEDPPLLQQGQGEYLYSSLPVWTDFKHKNAKFVKKILILFTIFSQIL